ncbi:MAG: polyphosphate kinase 1 [Candidatus Pseudobacter hemicellulosilyticus]|uniref:Polyphosphate kinase n=1 Tax=Candidatus Pseudobacter hemicellulosilyticus TaxID=3121375 RepID=A0AAJ5WV66_9BACT|nr:MAG: polyphosphate kinase 1 [Pseudobacter sp.]
MEQQAGQNQLPDQAGISSPPYFNRDLSWLSFNERVLQEAGRQEVPLMERIRFLSIWSSNLDEFYRVRVPALMALEKLGKKKQRSRQEDTFATVSVPAVSAVIHRQQELFGATLAAILPQLSEQHGISLVYNQPIPEIIRTAATDYFYNQVLAFLQPVHLADPNIRFFPENNKLYFLVSVSDAQHADTLLIVAIPSDQLPRFHSIRAGGRLYILFLDDIIRDNLAGVMPQYNIQQLYSFKVTRDGDLGIADEYEGDLAEKIEKQIARRDLGFATRFLYDAQLPAPVLESITSLLSLSNANNMEGGPYHNLKDLSTLPINDPALLYPHWPVSTHTVAGSSLLDEIGQRDLLLHPPYQSYHTVLRFFNEAAIDPWVEEIYITVYRIASDSKIAHALISAARNGKKVVVFVELKARFDEANNVRWAKLLKAAGVQLIYSIPTLKVHAKVALVKKIHLGRTNYYGLLSTGNMNESTARFYTDHLLFTSRSSLLLELEQLFRFLSQRKKPQPGPSLPFSELLIAQFNLQERFLQLMDREIANARQGLPAGIRIKLNNLEERVLINKLYEASAAGVPVELLVRSICCCRPGIPGLSENIRIKRMVDRYLEHGRIFIFTNNGDPELYMGSADWMNRNIYRRIEVCFPILDPALKATMLTLVEGQWKDNTQAVWISPELENIPVTDEEPRVRSQEMISRLLSGKEA